MDNPSIVPSFISLPQTEGMIQVAGVHDPVETRLLLEEGVDLIGLPLRLPVNADDLSEPEAVRLSRAFPGRCCLITYMDQPEPIIDFARQLGVTAIQLHGVVDPGILPQIRENLPGTGLIKSLVVGRYPEEALRDHINRFSPHVDAFITDTFNPDTGAEGATGLTHDWSVSRRLREHSPRPLILAGGLTPENVAEAIRTVQPWGVDVHSGVEGPDGRKDRALVRAFVEAARLAFQDSSSGSNEVTEV